MVDFIGNFETRKLKPTKHTQTFVVPKEILRMLIKNKSQFHINICFNNGKIADSYEMEPNEKLPILDVKSGVTILKYSSETGKGELNVLLWG